MSDYERFEQLSSAKKEALLGAVADNYGQEAAETMDTFVSFAASRSAEFLQIDPTNPDPAKVELAIKGIAAGFNRVLNTLYQPLPGKRELNVGIQ